MDFMHPAMRQAFAPITHLPSDLEQEVRGLRALVKSLKLLQLQNAEFIESIKTDAYRYRHLRDFFALHSESDTEAFAELALLTGSDFDAAIDKSRA
jgi:hypothetical protein